MFEDRGRRDYYDGPGPVKITFIVLGVIAVLVIGWFIYRFFAGPVTPTNIGLKAPVIKTPPTSATYTDDSKIYTITYPVQRWSAHEASALNLGIPLPPLDNKMVNFIPAYPVDSGYGAAGTLVLIGFKAPGATVLADAKNGSSTGVKSMTIDGYPALYEQYVNTAGTTFTDDDYAVTHNGVTLYFTFRQEQGPSGDDEGFDATSYLPDVQTIVGSTKFLN